MQGFFDSSIVLIAQAQASETPTYAQKIFAWMGPLHPSVWGLTMVLAMCVGAAHAIIEHEIPGSDTHRDHALKNGVAATFLSLLHFTGGGQLAPRSFPGTALLLGWSLFVLILVNSFSANLRAFLITSRKSSFKVVDLDDAVSRRVRVCAWANSAIFEVLKAKYPTINIVPSSGSDGLIMLQQGRYICIYLSIYTYLLLSIYLSIYRDICVHVYTLVCRYCRYCRY